MMVRGLSLIVVVVARSLYPHLAFLIRKMSIIFNEETKCYL